MTEQPAALSLEEQLRLAQEQIQLEKAGKRKLFHSLVKVANELRKTRVAEQQYQNQEQRHQQQYSRTSTSTWYEGGLWRAPKILPAVLQQTKSKNQSKLAAATSTIPGRLGRPAISLSDLFFHLVIVTAFTRVGVAIGSKGRVDGQSFLYFAMIFTVWHKESSYANRFDTTDLSAQITTLLTCFAVLFASLSVSAPLPSPDGTRIMATAAFVATLHCALHIRVAWTNCTTTVVDGSSSSNENKGTVQPSISDMCCCGLRSSSRHSYEATLSTEEEVNNNKDALIMVQKHVMRYAVLNSAFTAAEAAVWMVGILVLPEDWPYRWCLFTAALVLGLRVPRAFLVDDFHGACSKRGVLFILLLGFLLQSLVVVASEFFEYQTPSLEHYSFVGASCLMFFCIKLLYVDDVYTRIEDHAVLVNRYAAILFNFGQFLLLLSTTVMGSGLNLLTHDYLASSAALPGPAKSLVTGGFSAVLFSTFFIKSMHLKRIPTDPRNRALFIGAFVIQSVVWLVVVLISAAMSMGGTFGALEYLMQTDSQLLFCLSGSALFVVIMSWLDEGVELALYESASDSRAFRVEPFGLWWCCLKPDVVTDEDILHEIGGEAERFSMSSPDRLSSARLSVLSPLLGSSLADIKALRGSMYHSVPTELGEGLTSV